MNDLTTQQQLRSSASLEHSALTTELAKMLGLVAPITMSADQQTLWLASAVDALQGIRAVEVAHVSAEIRRTVTRPSQIVPEVARLVVEKRSSEARMREITQPVLPAPRSRNWFLDHRGKPMTEEDTNTLNGILANLGTAARYRADGSRYTVEA